MDKKEFTYQRWHMRMLGAVFVLPIVYGIQMLINRVLENNPKLKKDKRNPYWYELEKE